jgi:hypothetical protein
MTARWIAPLILGLMLVDRVQTPLQPASETSVKPRDERLVANATGDERRRLGNLPSFLSGGPQNPMGAGPPFLLVDGKDTPFRIRGTNQPGCIGLSISSCCIRMTNLTIGSKSAPQWLCWRSAAHGRWPTFSCKQLDPPTRT